MMKRINLKQRYVIDDSVYKEMKNKFLCCQPAIKFVKELKLDEKTIDENITLINDLVDDCNYCRNCPGFENCEKENPHVCTKLTYIKGIVERHLIPCKLYAKRIGLLKHFIYRDFDENLINYSIKDINQISEERKKILIKYLNHKNKKNSDWIFIKGANNTGKSFITALLSLDAAKSNVSDIVYIYFPEIIKELANDYYKDSARFEDVLSTLALSKFLVLDEFGNEEKNNLIREKIVLPLLRYREEHNLFTIFTSEKDYDCIENEYCTSKAGFKTAKELVDIIARKCKKEINLGDQSIY